MSNRTLAQALAAGDCPAPFLAEKKFPATGGCVLYLPFLDDKTDQYFSY